MDQNEGETMMPEYILTAKRMEINRLQHEQWENMGKQCVSRKQHLPNQQ